MTSIVELAMAEFGWGVETATVWVRAPVVVEGAAAALGTAGGMVPGRVANGKGLVAVEAGALGGTINIASGAGANTETESLAVFAIGRLNLKVLPWPGMLSTQSRP